MITGKNEPKILTKDISYKCKCRFDAKKCNSDQCWNDDKCWCDPGTCNCENSKHLASIMDGLTITCDEIIKAELKSNNEETKRVPTDFNYETQPLKHKICIFYLSFLLIAIASTGFWIDLCMLANIFKKFRLKHEICFKLTIKPPEHSRKNKIITVNTCSNSTTLATTLCMYLFTWKKLSLLILE